MRLHAWIGKVAEAPGQSGRRRILQPLVSCQTTAAVSLVPLPPPIYPPAFPQAGKRTCIATIHSTQLAPKMPTRAPLPSPRLARAPLMAWIFWSTCSRSVQRLRQGRGVLQGRDRGGRPQRKIGSRTCRSLDCGSQGSCCQETYQHSLTIAGRGKRHPPGHWGCHGRP